MGVFIIVIYLLVGFFAVMYAVRNEKKLEPVAAVFTVIVWLPVFIYGITVGLMRADKGR